MWLVRRPGSLSNEAALALFAVGALMVWVNYDSDRQRAEFRRTGGKAKVWGRAPTMITALYVTGNGEVKESLLLASGWWGLARHFHYLPEILAAFVWSCPGGFDSVIPFFYVIFLTVLLADRAYRDDERCAAKYGAYWDKYRALVHYRVVPLLF
jgi:7-dehydrocholesterol reductase